MNATEAYKVWLKKQEELEPLLPIRFMAELIGTGHSTVQAYLKELVELGWVEEIPMEDGRKRYRMIKDLQK